MNGDPVALRPTWKSNLGWLLLVAVIVIAVASRPLVRRFWWPLSDCLNLIA
jgi:hypothetical protein